MKAKPYDLDSIERIARVHAEARVHAAPVDTIELLAMCADIRRYEKALTRISKFKWESGFITDAAKIAKRALTGDSDGATATGSAEPDAEGKA